MDLGTGIEAATMETAVLGGAIFGCGGGGKLEDGLCLGESASPQLLLLPLDALPADSPHTVAVILPLHGSAVATERIDSTQTQRALTNLADNLAEPVTHLLNGGCGAVESLLGWAAAAAWSLPLLDGVVPATHHPCSLENLLYLQQELVPERSLWVSLVGPGMENEQVWHGRPRRLLTRLSELNRRDYSSCAVAVGPFSRSHLALQSEGSTMQVCIKIGNEIVAIDRPTGEVVSDLLAARCSFSFSTFATVTKIVWAGSGRDATGTISLRDMDGRNLQLIYSYRYRQLSINGRLWAHFPACIITLGIFGTPITGEELFVGQDIYLQAKP